MSTTLKRLLGLDTHAERYTYGVDPVMGHTATRKIPDRWVSTTCGYCSVGCGMFIGVKDGRAVSVRGNPDHPVNTGLLCPKGLSEHDMLHVSSRAQLSAAARPAWIGARGLGRRHRHDGASIPRDPAEVRTRIGRRHQHGTTRHRGVLHAGQAGAAWPGHAQLRRQHDALHVDRGRRIQAVVRQRRSAGRLRGSGARRRHPPDRREHRRKPSDPLAAARSQSRARR